jgi:hypothetical protein
VARIPVDAFEEGTEIVRVYLAASLAEAEAAERALSGAGIEYGVEVEELAGRNLFGLRTSRRGAGLWVRAAAVDAAADALERAGCLAGLVERGGPG